MEPLLDRRLFRAQHPRPGHRHVRSAVTTAVALFAATVVTFGFLLVLANPTTLPSVRAIASDVFADVQLPIERSLAAAGSGVAALDSAADAVYRWLCPYVGTCGAQDASTSQQPVPRPAAPAITTATTTPALAPQPVYTPPSQQTVINQPARTEPVERVIERVIEREVAVAADSSAFTIALQQMEQSFSQRLAAVAASIPSTQNFVSAPSFAHSQKIDNLSNVSITNPTITGGSIEASSISGTIGNAIESAAATITSLTATEVTFTRATTTDFVATNATTTNLAVSGSATSSFSGGISATRLNASATSTLSGLVLDGSGLRFTTLDCSSFANGGTLTTDGSGNVVCAADDGGSGGSVGGSNTQVQFNNNGSFAGDSGFTYASTTDLLTVTNASTTALTAGYASTSNLVASNSFTFRNVTGFLKATAGAVATALIDLASDVTGILPVANGGTGWSNISANTLLTGNGSGALATTTVGNGLSLSAGVLATSFGTTTANTWTALQSFSAGASTTRLSVFDTAYFGGSATSSFSSTGALTLATALAASSGGTGTSTPASYGNVLAWNGSNWQGFATSSLALNTDNLVEGSSSLFWTNIRFDNRLSATTTLPSITTLANLATVGTITSGTWNGSTVGVAYGGTGATSFGQGWVYSAGGTNALAASTSPTLNYIVATSTSQASIFPYASTTALSVSGTAYFPGSGIWTSSGRVGIGTSTPTFALDVYTADGSVTIGDITAGLASTDAGLTMTGNGTSTSGIFTEVDGKVLSYGINVPQITTRDTATVGGIFRFDTRPSEQQFNVWGYAAGSSDAMKRLSVSLQDGTTVLAQNGGSVGIGTTTPWAKFSIANSTNDTAGQALFTISSSTASATTTLFHITNTGNVGIGTTNPDAVLNVVGTGDEIAHFRDSSTGADLVITSSGSGIAQILASSGDQLGLGAGNSEALRIAINGNVGIGTTTPWARLSVHSNSGDNIPAFHISGGGDAAGEHAAYILGRSAGFAADVLRLASNRTSSSAWNLINAIIDEDGTPTSAFVLRGDGNVGIGTTAPANKFTTYLGANEIAQFNDGANQSAIWGMNVGLVSSSNEAAITTRSTSPLVFYTGGTLNGMAKGTERMRIDPTNGNVGIGTTNPDYLLSVNNNFGDASVQINAANASDAYIRLTEGATTDFGGMLKYDGSTNVFQIGTLDDDTEVPAMYIRRNSSSVGIGTTTPWRTLSVTGTVGFDGLTSSTGAGSLCLSSTRQVVYNSGSDACLSSLRDTKHDINPLVVDALSQVLALQPVSFVYNEGDSRTRYGFIAEDTAVVDEHLTTYDASGTLSGIDDRSILSIVVKAIQDLWARVNEYFDRTERLEARVAALEAQIAAVSAAGSSGNSSAPQEGETDTEPAPVSDVEPPTITINGNNPAVIHVGDAYSDLGATVTDNVDSDLGYQTFLASAGSPQVGSTPYDQATIDTSEASEWHIHYVATDNAGNTATSTRTVIVESPSLVPEQEEEEEPEEHEPTPPPDAQ